MLIASVAILILVPIQQTSEPDFNLVYDMQEHVRDAGQSNREFCKWPVDNAATLEVFPLLSLEDNTVGSKGVTVYHTFKAARGVTFDVPGAYESDETHRQRPSRYIEYISEFDSSDEDVSGDASSEEEVIETCQGIKGLSIDVGGGNDWMELASSDEDVAGGASSKRANQSPTTYLLLLQPTSSYFLLPPKKPATSLHKLLSQNLLIPFSILPKSLTLTLNLFVSKRHPNLPHHQPSRKQSECPKTKIEIDASNICEDWHAIEAVLRNF